MRPAICVGLALVAGLVSGAPALAQGAAPRATAGVAGPVTAKSKSTFRLSRLLAVRARSSVRDAAAFPGQGGAPRDHASTLAFHGAIVDVYPLGGGLRVSAGWDGDLSYSEALLSDRGNAGETVLGEGAVPSFTVGYGRAVKGPLNVAVDGGLVMRDRQREGDPNSPRLNNSVSRLYPVVRLSLSRAF